MSDPKSLISKQIWETAWPAKELARHFSVRDNWVDLNSDGKIQEPEKVDLNDDHIADHEEWRRFLSLHRPEITSKAGSQPGLFRNYYAFKPDNPIHDIIAIESLGETILFTRHNGINSLIANIYDAVGKILERVKNDPALKSYSPEQKLKLVYDTIKFCGFSMDKPHQTISSILGDANAGSNLFIHNINRGQLDCDTSSFIVLAVAHEMGWPVHAVRAPGHMFVRWDDGAGKRFNMDFGNLHDDDFYPKEFEITSKARADGIYLKNLTRDQLVSSALASRAIAQMPPDYRATSELLREAIRIDPKNITARINLLSIYARGNDPNVWIPGVSSKNKDPRLVTDALQALTRLDPDSSEIHLFCGHAMVLMDRREDAIRHFTRAIEIKPNNLEAVIERAKVFQRLKRYDDALKDYERLLKALPDAPGLLLLIGETYHMNENYQKAIEYYDKAIQGGDIVVHRNRAWANESLGKYKEAIDDYKTYIDAGNKDTAAYLALGRLLISQRRYEEAVTMMERGIKDLSENAAMHYYLGRAKYDLGRYQEAALEFETATRVKNAEDFILFGNLHGNLGKRAPFQHDFDQWERSAAYLYLGKSLMELGRSAEADAALEKAYELDPSLDDRRSLHMEAALAPRINISGSGVDLRNSFGISIPLFNRGKDREIGIRASLGYSANDRASALGGDGALTMKWKVGGSAITANAGAGYDFNLKGDAARSALPAGAFLMYGLTYDHRLSDGVMLRA
ncbi:MAG: tetratricopeptide repeat protein, partial [bacterium]